MDTRLGFLGLMTLYRKNLMETLMDRSAPESLGLNQGC